jgi:uncharacterized protein YukE
MHVKSVVKVKELRETTMKLKTEIGKIKTVLIRETGEDEKTVDKIINGNDQTWKGRAQQIILLKSKVKELSKQLENQKGLVFVPIITKSSVLGSNTLSSSQDSSFPTVIIPTASTSTLNFSTSPNQDMFDDRNRTVIETLEKDKKADVVDLKKVLQTQADEIKEHKQRAEAVQARNRILEKSNSEYKTKVTRILEKTENDNKLIDAFKAELEKTKKSLRTTEQKASKGGPPPKPNDLQKKIDDLAKEVQQKEDMIKQLRSELQAASKKALEMMQSSLASVLGESGKSGDTKDGLELKFTIANIEVEKMKELRTIQSQRLSELEKKVVDLSK